MGGGRVKSAGERCNRATGSGSGGRRYARVCTLPVPLMLPVVGQIGAHAA